MKKELFDFLATQIQDAYANLFLVAIDRKYNLRLIVDEIARKTDKYLESNKGIFIPRGFEGILFIEAMAKAMGSTFPDVANMSEVEKRIIVYNILSTIDPQKIGKAEYEYDEYEDFTNIEYIYFFNDVHGKETFYEINIYRRPNEDKEYNYSVAIMIWKDSGIYGVDTDLMYDSALVWEEKEGSVKDFVESVIELQKCDYAGSEMEDSKESIENEIEKLEETEESEKSVYVERLVVGHKKPEANYIDGKQIIEELIAYVANDTGSVKLMDRFEGYGSDAPAYRRMVIQNTKYRWTLDLKNNAGINLVIERSKSRNYVGDITFTEFKQEKDRNLRDFLKQEITDEIAEKYIDKDEFFRFSKPFRLRAQNSGNRTGYGWEWDWSGGYGDYTEGTLYGETTDYVFAGAYITSSAHLYYDPKHRKPFSSLASAKNRDNNVKTEVQIIPYDGKLAQITEKELEQCFLLVEKSQGRNIKLPVSYDPLDNVIYIASSNYEKYKEQLQDCVLLEVKKGAKR